jgi:transcriptional regulator with XRE-family HTH domain
VGARCPARGLPAGWVEPLPASPSSSAQQARDALGVRLREIRLDAGLTARELGRRMGRHGAKVSRIEHGVVVPSAADIQAWCTHCGVPDQAPDLVAALRTIESAYVEWRRLEVTGLRHLQTLSVPLYEQTRRFRVYHSLIVPGLLQTPAYARSLLNVIMAFRHIPDDVERAVVARVDRQRVLSSGDHRFAVLVEEAVLRCQVGGPDVMAGQLGHLLAVSTLPAVSFGVVPFASQRRPVLPIEGFMIFDSAQVNVELLSARVIVKRPSEVALYERAHAMLSEIAVYGPAARALITAAISSLDDDSRETM